MQDLKKNVDDISDESQVEEYLRKLLHKEAFDQKGLIYGMGHAVYFHLGRGPRGKVSPRQTTHRNM